MGKSEAVKDPERAEREHDRAVVSQVSLAMKKLYGSWWLLISRSFISGLFAALGATVGLAIFLTVAGYIFKWLGVIPGLSQLSEALNNFLSISALLRR